MKVILVVVLVVAIFIIVRLLCIHLLIIMTMSIDRRVRYNKFSRQTKDLVSYVAKKDVIPMSVREQNNLYGREYTCNHTHEFKLDNESRLWVRSIKFDCTNSSKYDKDWKVLFTPNKTKLVSIWSDGTNLIVQDTNGKMFYKKCILDWREKKTKEYRWTDQLKSKEKRWRYIWSYRYSLCVRTDRTMTLSHRGYWNHFSIDKRNNNPIHTDEFMRLHIGGTTSIYVIKEDHVLVLDPMAPFKYKFKFPKKLHHVQTTSSASTILYIGYDTREKNWKFYYKTVDYDMAGLVPHMYVYKNVDSEWKEIKHDLKLDPQEWTLGGTKLQNLGDNEKLLTTWWYNKRTIIKLTSQSDKYLNFSNMSENIIHF